MGIHYTYKSTQGERDLKKRQKQNELQRRSNQRKKLKQQRKESEVYVVPENEIVTLDILTNPDRKSDQ
jgi:hypothetical protein